jgi:hypothetical protein
LLSTFDAKLLGFEQIKEVYTADHDFTCARNPQMVGILGMMDFCFVRTNYACLIALCENCWLENPMVEA